MKVQAHTNGLSGWRLEPATGLRAVAVDENGWAPGDARTPIRPRPDGPGCSRSCEPSRKPPRDAPRRRALRCEQPLTEDFPIIGWALQAVNDKKMVAPVIVALSGQSIDGPPKMRLPMMRDGSALQAVTGRQASSDGFYQRLVPDYVAYCKERGIAFGPPYRRGQRRAHHNRARLGKGSLGPWTDRR